MREIRNIEDAKTYLGCLEIIYQAQRCQCVYVGQTFLSRSTLERRLGFLPFLPLVSYRSCFEANDFCITCKRDLVLVLEDMSTDITSIMMWYHNVVTRRAGYATRSVVILSVTAASTERIRWLATQNIDALLVTPFSTAILESKVCELAQLPSLDEVDILDRHGFI